MYYGPFGSSLDVMGGAGLRARGPRLLSMRPHPGWKLCALTVIDCKVRLCFIRSIGKPCFKCPVQWGPTLATARSVSRRSWHGN